MLHKKYLKEENKKTVSAYFGWAGNHFLFTSAIPLLHHEGAFVCFFSDLDRCAPP